MLGTGYACLHQREALLYFPKKRNDAPLRKARYITDLRIAFET